MKRGFTILGIALAAFLFTENKAHTYASGAPEGNTASPGDGGATCNSGYCHSGPQATDETLELLVTTSLSVGEYGISVIAKSETPGQYEKAGFQACVEDENGNKIGELVVSDNTTTKIIGQDYITHKYSGTAPSQEVDGDHHIWNFTWVAPEGYEGVATVYAVVMLANNDAENTGDVHVASSHSFNVSVGVEEMNAFDFSVFPNPVSDQINLTSENAFGDNTRISLVDIKGSEVLLFEGDLNQYEYSLILPSGIAKGIYALKVQSDNGLQSKKIILE